MGEVGGNTGGVDNIVEGQFVDVRAGFEQQRERLSREQEVSQRSRQTFRYTKIQVNGQYIPGQCHQRHPRRLY